MTQNLAFSKKKDDGCDTQATFNQIENPGHQVLTHGRGSTVNEPSSSKHTQLDSRERMGGLVSANQSAFIRGHNLHDNFVLVRQVARKLHQRKAKGVLLMLDSSCV